MLWSATEALLHEGRVLGPTDEVPAADLAGTDDALLTGLATLADCLPRLLSVDGFVAPAVVGVDCARVLAPLVPGTLVRAHGTLVGVQEVADGLSLRVEVVVVDSHLGAVFVAEVTAELRSLPGAEHPLS